MTSDAQMEQTVIGAMLLSTAGLTAALELKPSDFTLDWNRRIFSRVLAMHGAGLDVDSVTLTAELMRTGELEAVGGPGYLCDLTDHLNRGTAPPVTYVRLVKRNAARRHLASLGALLQTRAEQGDDPEDIASDLATALVTAQTASADVRPVRIAEYIIPTIEELERQRKCTGEALGISSGIPDLDTVTTGWRGGELTYIGALPGRGKTSFMLQAMYAAASQGIGVGCISLEMRATQLVRRLAIMHSHLSPRKLRDARDMNATEFQHIKASLFGMGDLPITITDQSGLSPGQIASQARQMYEMGARLICIDFVQIVREDGRDRREAVNRVSATLRDTCKALNVPFLVASQLARGDKDLNRRPTMQDLRESGNLEQDAHNVLLLYRPVDDEGEWSRADEIIVAKQREGVTGRVDVSYSDATLTFEPRRMAQALPTPITHGRTGTRGR